MFICFLSLQAPSYRGHKRQNPSHTAEDVFYLYILFHIIMLVAFYTEYVHFSTSIIMFREYFFIVNLKLQPFMFYMHTVLNLF